MRSHSLAFLASLLGLACVLAPSSANAQAGAGDAPRAREGAAGYRPMAPLALSPWQADPFAGMLLGFEAPSGVGLGLVFTQLDEPAPAPPAHDAYSSEIDGHDLERSASLVAYPVGRGVLVTGMLRYVQLGSALDIALGRSAPWSSVAARGGGIGLVGAF